MRALLLEALELLLELRQPRRHKLNILEHHPATLEVHLVECFLCDPFLAEARAEARDDVAAERGGWLGEAEK